MAAKSKIYEVVFASNSSTNLCECHGMEIAIGALSKDNLEEITRLVEEGTYLESDYFTSWYEYSNTYHENGVYLDGSEIEDLDDKDGLSSSNFEIGNVILNDVILDKNTSYLCTFRNETIYMVAKGLVEVNEGIKVDFEISKFGFLEELADVNVSIIKSTSIALEQMNRDSADEEDSGEIYDTNQFLIKDGKIVFFATNGNGQYPFYLDDSILKLNIDTDEEIS